MESPDNKNLPSDVRQRLYLIGFLLCMLGVVGIGILFLMPNATLDGWLLQTEPDSIAEEWTGDAGSLPRTATGSVSNGASHNDSIKPPASLPRAADDNPASIAAAPQVLPERPADAPTPDLAVAERVEVPAAQPAARTSPKPASANPAAVPVTVPAMPAQQAVAESGVGEITILAIPPGVYVGVADQVVTQAPATVRVPWPADYEVTVKVGESTIYATRLYLSAENHEISFSVGAETTLAAANSTIDLVADAPRHARERAGEPGEEHLVGLD